MPLITKQTRAMLSSLPRRSSKEMMAQAARLRAMQQKEARKSETSSSVGRKNTAG